MTYLNIVLSINYCNAGGQDHVLPGPAGELKQQIMAGQAPGTQPDVVTRPLPPAPQPLPDDRELFGSGLWQAAHRAAGMASSLQSWPLYHQQRTCAHKTLEAAAQESPAVEFSKSIQFAVSLSVAC